MSKKSIRNIILSKRKTMSENEVISKSNRIIKTFMDSDFYKSSKVIMTYVDFRNEVKTNDLIIQSLPYKRIIVPKTVPETKELILSELKDFELDLDIGEYGVLEPSKDSIRVVSHDIIDLILVPGSVFDVKGNRIGYGAGYYDRFFSKLDKSIPKIALAYDFQIVDKLTPDNYDVPMDYIITESRIIDCATRK